MKKNVARIVLKAYDHELLDDTARQIVEAVKSIGVEAVKGPIPMPTKVEKITILRAVHKYKDSREQFEQRTHKRIIDIITPGKGTMKTLSDLDISAGVFMEIQTKIS